jgi:hypothetical protein
MDYSKRVTSGVQKVPDLMAIYGVEGVGKTTFASKAAKPLFADIEGGSKRVETKRISDFKDVQDFWNFLNWFYVTDHGYSTLVIDSLSEFERFAWQQTCLDEGCESIEHVGGGFSKGYTVALKQWQILKDSIKKIQTARGTNIILIGHAEIKTFTDPATNSAYDRYSLKLHKHAAAFIREWVDFIGFANYQTWTKGTDKQAKHKAFGTEKRRLYTERRPAWDAKNRLGLPLEMDFDYQTYALAAHADPETKAQRIRDAITQMLTQTTDADLKKKVLDTVAKAGTNSTDLAMIQERLSARLTEMEDKKDGTT